ncbi:kinase-like domain-containing protein [Cristinia sonorae]|uniref:Kinase-like domain-containing protein n=1 Tax=Cristinia sonorae TaxID=1940300 RepID=A0A8K0UQ76_9AGAR|nr:kinase-like domain-containing protein [Cristinia sonorae]
MHGSKTLSWYSQLPRDATEGSQLALSDARLLVIVFEPPRLTHINPNRYSTPMHKNHPHSIVIPLGSPLATLSMASCPSPKVPSGERRLRSLYGGRSALRYSESLTSRRLIPVGRIQRLKLVNRHICSYVLVLSRKRHTKKLSVIKESVDSGRGKKVDISSFKLARLILDSVATKVLLGTIHGSSKCYMIKVIRQELVDAKGFQEVIREHRLLKFVTQNKLPFLPRLFWSFLDANHLYIVNGYASEPLHGMLDRNNSSFGDETLFYISELVVAVSALHSSGIVLRCILPDDIRLADDGHLVLTGLAHAAYLSHPNMECQANVSPPIHECPDHLGEEEIQFSAPELLLGWSYDTKVDVWSIGMFLYVLLVGKHPFLDSTEKTIERDAQDNHDLLLRAALQSESLASLNDDVAVLISQVCEYNDT